MNIIDHLASTCNLTVRSFQSETGIVPSIIIESTGWGKLMQSLLDNQHCIADDATLSLRMKQFLQHIRTTSCGPSYTIVYPMWFPMSSDEDESLHMEDCNGA